MSTSTLIRRRRSVEWDGALILSRLDFPSTDTRVGLWIQAAKQAGREQRLGVAVINGGLVSHKAVVKRQKAAAAVAAAEHLEEVQVWKDEKEAINAANKALPKGEAKELLPTRAEYGLLTKPEAERLAKRAVLDEIVKELAVLLPVITDASGKVVKTYIVTTPAVAYDGPYGGYIADELSKVRKDLVAWSDSGDARLPLKGMYLSDDPDSPLYMEEHVLALLLPDRALWASKNASTGIQKIIREKGMQSSQALPSLYIVGCVGTYVQRPDGANRGVGVLGVPALHKISRVRGSENQIGYMIVRFRNNEEGFVYFPQVYSAKDQIQDERNYIDIPEDANDYQKAILQQLQKHPRTIGQLADSLPWERSTIQRALDQYMDDSTLQPKIVKSGSLYDIDSQYLMLKLRYPLPSPKSIVTDSLIAWSCQHAGSVNTQYDWFNDELPKLILEHGITCAFNAGDQQEGMKHNLAARGELIGGVNYSVQQILAAVMPGNVILQVFEARLKDVLKGISFAKRKKFTKKRVQKIVDEALMWYYHISGNHDQWVLDEGFTPLAGTHDALPRFIYWGCRKVLKEEGIRFEDLLELVSRHITYGNDSVLPSGLPSHTRHPHMGRSQTWSAKAEESMVFSGSPVSITGNYHDAASVTLWSQRIGQTIGVSLGTIKDRSQFEENKNKHVDNNVWIAEINSVNKRIISTQDIFVGPKKGTTKTYPPTGGIPTVLMRAMLDTFPPYDSVWNIIDRPEDAA